MLIGYARVSTDDQNLHLQKDALAQVGCEEIFEDTSSGAKADRPGLHQALRHLRADDILVVWRLDRLSRSLRELIAIMNQLETRSIGFKSLQESLDTSSSTGKLIFHMFGALAEFERNLIRERTQAGLQAARARGRLGGRPTALTIEQQRLAVQLYHQKQHTVQEICDMMSISKPTLYKYVETHSAKP